MIIDLRKFTERERPFWSELEQMIERAELTSGKLDMEQALRLHYLYERAAAGLARINTFSSDPQVTRRLESLVARTYALIHAMDRSRRRFRPIKWFFGTFPRTFRGHIQAFMLSLAITLGGVAFGALAVAIDPDAKEVIMPFEGLRGDPSERVKHEEEQQAKHDPMAGARSFFASMLMTHNMQVSIATLALGVTWGVGTIAMLFYNGVILGAVCLDYVRAGQAKFLAGWLLPHGSIEIPAILLAGQAGLVLASALIGRGDRNPLKARLRGVMPSLVTLICGVGILLVWAGIVESFFSQYHEPILPYWLKIAFGCVELGLLAAFLALSGRREIQEELEE
ncbi:MAG: stage II sporulation protein M [Phycisphaerae bacterium]